MACCTLLVAMLWFLGQFLGSCSSDVMKQRRTDCSVASVMGTRRAKSQTGHDGQHWTSGLFLQENLRENQTTSHAKARQVHHPDHRREKDQYEGSVDLVSSWYIWVICNQIKTAAGCCKILHGEFFDTGVFFLHRNFFDTGSVDTEKFFCAKERGFDY